MDGPAVLMLPVGMIGLCRPDVEGIGSGKEAACARLWKFCSDDIVVSCGSLLDLLAAASCSAFWCCCFVTWLRIARRTFGSLVSLGSLRLTN